MRSEEVDEAIKNLKDDCRGTELNTIVCYKTDIKTALVYIEELEKKLECIKNVTPSGYINGKYLEEIANRYVNKDRIRDKIKELEEECEAEERRCNYDVCECIRKQIEVLKSIIGESNEK